MKRLVIALAFAAVAAGVAAAAEVKLPAPQKTGGMPLFEAIDKRASAPQSPFPSGTLSEQDWSTILWAASGHNRNGRLWTVPMAMGYPPYCKVYITRADGVFLYNWKNHSLEQVNGDNVHASIPMQEFAKKSPAALYVVVDGRQIAALKSPFGDEFGPVLAGAMSQNVYLACLGVDVGARLIYSIKREEASKLLKLADGDTPLFAIVLGKYR